MTQIWEHIAAGVALAEVTVDRRQNLIQGVTLLSRTSKNNRTYSDKALDDAVRLYARAPFYLDHPTEGELRQRAGSRSVLDLAGEIVNPRLVGDKVRGDIHVLEREPAKSLVFAIAEQMPHRAGMSHRARGSVRPGARGEGDVVDGLAEVYAVELVTDPATTAGLFEALEREHHTPIDESKIKDYARRLGVTFRDGR